MTPTKSELEFVRIVKEVAAERNMDSLECTKAMIAAIDDGLKKYPGNKKKAQEHAAEHFNEMYPVLKEGAPV